MYLFFLQSCSEEDSESKRETPSIVLKFLMSASQLVPELGDLCHKKPFIEGLVATLFPLQASEQVRKFSPLGKRLIIVFLV